MQALECPFRPLFIILIGLLGSGLHVGSLSAQDSPDPLLLVQGAESARQQIAASSLKLRYIYCDLITTNESVVLADFDGNVRRFEHPARDANRSDWSSVFDGSRAITYEERLNQAAYRSVTTEQNELMLFDPRLLGLISAYAWDQSLQAAFPYRLESEKLELLGREAVGGRAAWHVRFSARTGSPDPTDYWIDDSTGFRVYRTDCNGIQTFSEYDNTNYPWLPSRVISRAYGHLRPVPGEIPRYTKEVQILEARANLSFPTNTWGLAGLKLKPGTDVIDLSLSRGLGVWDGKRLVKDFAGTPKATRSGAARNITLVIMCLTTAFLALLLFYLRRPTTHPQPPP
jgi:hypothetical protein